MEKNRVPFEVEWLFDIGDVIMNIKTKELWTVVRSGKIYMEKQRSFMYNAYKLEDTTGFTMMKNKDTCHSEYRFASTTEQVLYGRPDKHG